MRVRACGHLEVAGGPTYDPTVIAGAWQNGKFGAVADGAGLGNVDTSLNPGAYMDLLQSLAIASVTHIGAGVMIPPQTKSVGVVHTSDIIKNTTTCLEAGGGGASARADLSLDLALFDLLDDLQTDGIEIVAAGLLDGLAVPGTPAWQWREGFAAAVGYTGVGDYAIALADGYACDQEESVVLTSVNNVVPAGSDAMSLDINRLTDATLQARGWQEGALGAISVAAEFAAAVVIVRKARGVPTRYPRIYPAVGASIAGVAGTISCQNGMLTNLAHPIAGHWQLNLAHGFDGNNTCWLVTPRAAIAASGNTNMTVNQTADGTVHVYAVQEQAGGAASILADVDFDVVGIHVRGA